MGNCSSHNNGKLSNQRFFKVTILDPDYIDGSKGTEAGSGNLEVTKYELVLHQSGMQTLRWPYLSLTKYHAKGNVFAFEANSNKMLPGFTDRRVFLTKGANVLFNQIQALIVENSVASRSIKSGSSSKHSLENKETNDSEPKRFKENIDPSENLYTDLRHLHPQISHPELDLANIPFSRHNSCYHSSRHIPALSIHSYAMAKNLQTQRLSGHNQLSETDILMHNNNNNLKKQNFQSINPDDRYHNQWQIIDSNPEHLFNHQPYYRGMLIPPFLQQNYPPLPLPVPMGPAFIDHQHHPSSNRLYFPPNDLKENIKMSFSKALKNNDRKKRITCKNQLDANNEDFNGEADDDVDEAESDNTAYRSKHTRKHNILHNKSIHKSLEMLDLNVDNYNYAHHLHHRPLHHRIPSNAYNRRNQFVNEDSVNAVYYC